MTIPPKAHSGEPPAAGGDVAGRRWWLLCGGFLLLSAVWRVVLAALMPCLSRDGANYCWFARDLGREGLALLRADVYDQHPLFPLAILGVQRLLVACGLADSPLLWQRAGQVVACAAGLAVVLLCGLLARALSARLAIGAAAGRVGLIALLLAALLPLNTWLSADVMSDQLHLALYLGGVLAMLSVRQAGPAALCGVLAGLAFLTRPEGAAVFVAAGMVLAPVIVRERRPAVLVPLAGLIVGFAAVAGPYVAAIGGLSPKTDKERVEEFVARDVSSDRELTPPRARGTGLRLVTGRPAPDRPQQSALTRRETAWWEAAPVAFYQTLRAGRIVVPLAALPVLWVLRRRLFSEPLLGPAACIAMHFAATALLVHRHGYLDPRHTLVVVGLLIPFAAMALCYAAARLRPAAGVSLLVVACLPLAVYSLRIPNGVDGFVRRAGEWLADEDPHASQRLLLGGSSQRRIAFYADTRFQPWPENEPAPQRRFDALRAHLLGSNPDYFAIEVGRGDELAGNDELLARLLADAAVGPRLREVASFESPRGVELKLMRLLPAASRPATGAMQ